MLEGETDPTLVLYFRLLRSLILLRGVDEEVTHAARVAPLVIVPGDELDKVLVERDTGVRVEDRGPLRADKVGRDDLVLSVANDSLERTLGGFLDRVLDVIVSSLLLETANKIDNGDVEGRDTEGHAGELAVERRDDLANSLGRTGRRRNDVVVDGAATAPVLVGRTVNSLLGRGRSMDSSHETLHDAELVMDDLGEGRKTVGRAGSVGDLRGG
jgi:hypothetical protein